MKKRQAKKPVRNPSGVQTKTTLSVECLRPGGTAGLFLFIEKTMGKHPKIPGKAVFAATAPKNWDERTMAEKPHLEDQHVESQALNGIGCPFLLPSFQGGRTVFHYVARSCWSKRPRLLINLMGRC